MPWIPQYLRNEGNFIISLGGLVQWMATQAETLGIDVFAGFSAALPLVRRRRLGRRRADRRHGRAARRLARP